MPRVLGVVALAALAIGAVLLMRNTAPPVGEDGPGGLTEPGEVIEARRVLMLRVEQLMKPIDAFTVEESGDHAALQSAAATIGAMMLAFPHLFPPATNLYDAAARESPTFALPALWEDFPAFLAFAEASERAAAAMTESTDGASLRAAARGLRASCDGCHARFTKPYTPPRVTQEDLDFDFDSVFEKDGADGTPAR